MENVHDERARLETVLRQLSLPQGEWVLSGSGIMVLRGIQRPKEMGDVDVFVATHTWFQLYEQRDLHGDQKWRLWTTNPADPDRRCDPPYLVREMCSIEVNVFFQWRVRGIGDVDVNELIREAEDVRGWPCVRLDRLLQWKIELGRDKDLDDIRLIREELAAHG